MSPLDPPRTSTPRYLLVGVLAVLYGAFLALVAFWPTPIDDPVADLLKRLISELHERGMPSFIDYRFVEFLGNVALFVPIGALIGLALPRRRWVAMLLCGPALSTAVELVQRHFLSDRYASLSDIIANSIGSTLGVLIALAVRGLVEYRDGRVIARHEARADLIDSTS